MAENDQTTQRMDDAAKHAKEELDQHLEGWNARALATWWAKWYLQAGHKRLGRLLIDVSKSGA